MLPWPTINLILDLDLEQGSQFYSSVELELISFKKKKFLKTKKLELRGNLRSTKS